MIESVNEFIQSDRRVTVDDIARTLSLFVGTAHKIVQDDLGYSNFSCPWALKMLTAENKPRMVELCQQYLCRYEKDGGIIPEKERGLVGRKKVRRRMRMKVPQIYTVR
ncbi:unnamed protein product [Dicrocoelium dendriticum]|nr:unnamed protein product [Dicrocoelium dendriticum]